MARTWLHCWGDISIGARYSATGKGGRNHLPDAPWGQLSAKDLGQHCVLMAYVDAADKKQPLKLIPCRYGRLIDSEAVEGSENLDESYAAVRMFVKKPMEKRIDVDRLRTDLLNLRARLEKGFSPDTAVNGLQNDVPSAGHCAAATAIVWETLGGSLVSTSIRGMSHWFNRVQADDQLLDLDITGDQFGYPAVQIKPAEELYPYTRERSPDELNDETLHRAALLARRAGLSEVAEALEKRRQLLQSRLAV